MHIDEEFDYVILSSLLSAIIDAIRLKRNYEAHFSIALARLTLTQSAYAPSDCTTSLCRHLVQRYIANSIDRLSGGV